MLFFALFTALVFVCGVAIGATLFRDFIESIKPAPIKPRPLPLAVILSKAEWKPLDLPAVRRRQRMPIIDVGEPS